MVCGRNEADYKIPQSADEVCQETTTAAIRNAPKDAGIAIYQLPFDPNTNLICGQGMSGKERWSVRIKAGFSFGH